MTDLDTIMSERGNDSPAPEQNAPPAVEQSQPAAAPETTGQPRDEQGRFAPTAQEQAAAQAAEQPGQPPAEAQRPPDGFIPIQALDARLAKQQERFEAQLRERDEQFQRQMAMFAPQQPKQEPAPATDFFANPDAAFNERLQQAVGPLEQNQRGIVENFSRMLATEKFGEEAVNGAFAEIKTRLAADPSARFDYQRIMASPHPYGELVKWHKAQSALKTYGEDPAAYRERVRAELLAEIKGGGQPQPPTSPAGIDPSSLPTPFAQARNGGRATAQTWNGPRPLSEIKPS